MKKNLFLLVVGLLSSVVSFAQPEGWTDPTGNFTKTSTIVESEIEYYLYNVDADAWFAGGNNWWTAAVVYKTGDPNLSAEGMAHGFKFKLTDKQSDGSYHINQFYGPNGKYSSVNNKWFLLTDRADGAFFTDNSSGDTYWYFIPDNDGNFMIKSSKGNLKDNPVGLDAFTTDDGATSRGEGSKTGGANMTNKADVGSTTWALYCYGSPEAVAEWNAATALVTRMQEIFEESEEKFPIDSYAEQIGEQLGTLENAERLKSVLAQLNADYLIWKFNNGGKKAVEVALVNPSFETGKMSGWSALSGTSLYAAQGNKSFDRVVGDYYAEFWHKNGNYSASQTVNDLPVGLYKLSANVYSSNGKAKLFANDKETDFIEVSDRYSLIYELMLGAESTITFGIKSSDDNTSWNCVDDFSLKYLGTGGDAYANMFDVDYTGKASKQYVSGLAAKVAAVRTAEGDEAIQAAYKAAKDYEDGELAENIAAWAKYEQTLVDAQKLVDDPQFSDYTDELASMLQQRATIADDDLTTSEVNAENTAVQTEMNNVKSHIQPGTDISDTYLKNADFTQGLVTDPTKGWVVEGNKTQGCNWRISTGDKCGECWNGKDFDFYQIVENAPVGVYQIQVQGFTRAGRGAASWGYYFNTQTGELLPQPNFGNWTPNKANVYLNDNTGDLSISYAYGHTAEEAFFTKTDTYTDPLGQFIYPDGMGSAGESFAAGEYTVSAFGLVAKQGDPLRIGVKGNNYGLDNWTIFANFKLIYQGFQADIIEPEFTKAVASLETAHIGTELQAKLQDLKSRAGAVSHSDGKAMFNMLSEIYAFNTEKESSEEVFAELNQQIKDLEDALVKYKDTASEQALTDAKKLQGQAADAYEDEETLLPTVTTEAATTIIGQIGKALEALKIPKDSGSDDDPVDFTSVIKNANMASATGWTDAESNMTVDGTNKVAEFFNKENYNVYQKFTNLPAGVYEIQVQGFYRAGEIAQDWPAVVAGTESAPALYSIVESEGFDPEVFECPVRHISAEAINEDPSIAGTTSFKPFAEQGDETPWYMPNNLASTSQFFAAGDFYVNKIYFAIYNPSDTITIGLKKQGPATTNDWCAFSNWKLIGYGFESAKWDYLGAQTKSCDPVTPVFNPHAPLTALITEATTYYESIANNEEYKEVAAELKGAIDTAILVNDNTEATQQELDDAVTALKDALDKAKKATSISEVGAKAVKKLVNGKYFKNGKLFIIKNGKIFTATGAIIK